MVKKIIILSLVFVLITTVFILAKTKNIFCSNTQISNKNNFNQGVSSIKTSKKLYLTPTITYQNPQTYEILSWKRYSNNEMGILFDYPDNLDHAYPEGENPSALKEELNRVKILNGMGEIFSVEKIITNDDVETWWRKNKAENNNGNGLMPAKMTKTFFQSKPAYYFAIKDEQQVPSDFYIIP